jgi:hypothetical protein
MMKNGSHVNLLKNGKIHSCIGGKTSCIGEKKFRKRIMYREKKSWEKWLRGRIDPWCQWATSSGPHPEQLWSKAKKVKKKKVQKLSCIGKVRKKVVLYKKENAHRWRTKSSDIMYRKKKFDLTSKIGRIETNFQWATLSGQLPKQLCRKVEKLKKVQKKVQSYLV